LSIGVFNLAVWIGLSLKMNSDDSECAFSMNQVSYLSRVSGGVGDRRFYFSEGMEFAISFLLYCNLSPMFYRGEVDRILEADTSGIR